MKRDVQEELVQQVAGRLCQQILQGEEIQKVGRMTAITLDLIISIMFHEN